MCAKQKCGHVNDLNRFSMFVDSFQFALFGEGDNNVHHSINIKYILLALNQKKISAHQSRLSNINQIKRRKNRSKITPLFFKYLIGNDRPSSQHSIISHVYDEFRIYECSSPLVFFLSADDELTRVVHCTMKIRILKSMNFIDSIDFFLL